MSKTNNFERKKIWCFSSNHNFRMNRTNEIFFKKKIFFKLKLNYLTKSSQNISFILFEILNGDLANKVVLDVM